MPLDERSGWSIELINLSPGQDHGLVFREYHHKDPADQTCYIKVDGEIPFGIRVTPPHADAPPPRGTHGFATRVWLDDVSTARYPHDMSSSAMIPDRRGLRITEGNTRISELSFRKIELDEEEPISLRRNEDVGTITVKVFSATKVLMNTTSQIASAVPATTTKSGKRKRDDSPGTGYPRPAPQQNQPTSRSDGRISTSTSSNGSQEVTQPVFNAIKSGKDFKTHFIGMKTLEPDIPATSATQTPAKPPAWKFGDLILTYKFMYRSAATLQYLGVLGVDDE